MSSFRFDDCIFSRRLREQCDRQGLATADRLPNRTLETLKSLFPDWHSASLGNSIVEVTQHALWVWHAHGGRLVHDEYITLDRADLSDALTQVLRRNAAEPARRHLSDQPC